MKYPVGSNRFIFDNNKHPYIIAEIGVNHEGSLDLAKRLILEAKEGGADAAKFQSYKASSIASKNSPSYWDLSKEPTTSQHELFKKYDNFTPNDYKHLAQYCKEVGIDFLSTPFDLDAVDFLDPLMKFFKISSSDITNVPLLRKVAKKGKPIVLSTGASTLAEIEFALDVIKKVMPVEVILMHCILNYPTKYENANLLMIKSLSKVFPENQIGYSDHTLPDQEMLSLNIAYTLGSVVLEKHFTHDKSLPGNDHYHAMDKDDLLNLVRILKKTKLLIGDQTIKAPIPQEELSRINARRSVVAKTNIPIGTVVSEEHLICKRPASGISSLHWDAVIGKRVARNIVEDEILQWGDFI